MVKEVLQKKSSNMPRVIWAEESKTRSKIYGAATQDLLEGMESPRLNEVGIAIIQQIVGVCLYFVRP